MTDNKNKITRETFGPAFYSKDEHDAIKRMRSLALGEKPSSVGTWLNSQNWAVKGGGPDKSKWTKKEHDEYDERRWKLNYDTWTWDLEKKFAELQGIDSRNRGLVRKTFLDAYRMFLSGEDITKKYNVQKPLPPSPTIEDKIMDGFIKGEKIIPKPE